jgi:3-deoxy-7-phosphoheptulonate synthase
MQILLEVAAARGLPALVDVDSAQQLEQLASHTAAALALLIDESNMRNHGLLRAAGKLGRPVMLERCRSATLEELLSAAECIAAEGNEQIVLCERGIRTFEQSIPTTLDLASIPHLRQQTHLPLLVDVSRSCGRPALMAPLAKAAAACGADGIVVQVDADPRRAQSGGDQSLDPEQFAELMHALKPFVEAAGRTL